MSFSSLTFFVFVFLLFLGYYCLPKKWQWLWLLAGSYLFYMWTTPYFALFLFMSTFSTWLTGLMIGKANDNQKLTADQQRKLKHTYIVLCLFVNLGILAILKYTNLFIYLLDRLGGEFSTIDWLVLPLGISFYTFQSLGYCIDVYRGTALPERSIWRYSLYVAYFPQICQGPIGEYNEVAPQLKQIHEFDYQSFVQGLERVLLGLFKKLVVANRIAILVNGIYANYNDNSGLVLAYATFLYAFQLYADFSGYMDIALGVSEALGIRLAENFKTPYFASSIADFWRRWHITLGTWFRNYLYYPLLRSRLFTASGKKIAKLSNKKTSRLITSVLGLGITWLLIGMWHGSSVHYVIYGLYHGTFIIMETLFGSFYQKTKKWLKISDKNIVWRAFQILRTFMIVCFGYIFFRASSMTAVLTIIRKIFTDISFSAAAMETFYTATRVYLSTFQIHIINYSLIFLLLIEIIEARSALFVWFNKQPLLVRWLCLYLLIGATLFLGCYGSNDASSFIYFQF